ncbi:MAG: carboxypeptidase-like regulatory domain-containing protein [Acidobacteriota bacterium]
MVEDEDGGVVQGVTVELDYQSNAAGFVQRKLVDEAGRAVWEELPPGVYRINVAGAWNRGLAPLANLPYGAVPKVVLAEEASRELTVRLERGHRVSADVLLESDVPASVRIFFRHRDTGLEIERTWTASNALAEAFLPSGVWEVSAEAPTGLLLNDVWLENSPVLGSTARVDLLDRPADTRVGFHFVAEAEISALLSGAREVPGPRLRATLIEGGAWSDDTSARGGSRVDVVERRYNFARNEAVLPVPSGVWRVEPVAEVPLISEPEFVDIQLGVGEQRSLSFDIEPLGGDEALQQLQVTAALGPPSARRRRDGAEGAEVELFTKGALVASQIADKYGATSFYGLESEQQFDVIVDHEQALARWVPFRYHSSESRRANPESGEPAMGRHLGVQLDPGAGFDVEALDTAGRPLQGVELEVVRYLEDDEVDAQGEPLPVEEELYGPSEGGEDEDFERWIALRNRQSSNWRTVTTKRGGVARLRGLVAGLYGLQGRTANQDAVLGAIELRRPGSEWQPPGEDLLVELDDAEDAVIEARLVPRASLEFRVLCDDGGELPESADVEVYRTLRSVGNVTLGVADEEPALALESRRLSKSGRLLVAPLDRGAFEIAVKPSGFDRWTWAFEANERAKAVALTIESADVRRGALLRAGEFVVECAPALDLVLEPATAAVLRDGQLESEVKLFDITYARGGRPSDRAKPQDETYRELPAPRPRWRGNVLELRGLPAIDVRVRLELRHPDISPSGELIAEVEWEAQRGGYRRQVVGVE